MDLLLVHLMRSEVLLWLFCIYIYSDILLYISRANFILLAWGTWSINFHCSYVLMLSSCSLLTRFAGYCFLPMLCSLLLCRHSLVQVLHDVRVFDIRFASSHLFVLFCYNRYPNLPSQSFCGHCTRSLQCGESLAHQHLSLSINRSLLFILYKKK